MRPIKDILIGKQYIAKDNHKIKMAANHHHNLLRIFIIIDTSEIKTQTNVIN